jgi:hypothetical protein
MAELKYGWREGSGRGKEVLVAADQYFHRQGGHFVDIDSTGAAVLATTLASQVYGWLETPKDAAGKNAWKSSATAKADKAFVLYDTNDKFELPLAATTTANATMMGKGAGLQWTLAATYGGIQKAIYRATAASCLFIIVDFNTANQTVTVKIKPQKQTPGSKTSG